MARYVKGQSGNPSGRPKTPDNVKEAFKKATPAAIRELNRILENPTAKDSDKIRAAEVIFDRAWGKAVQAVDIDGKVDVPTTITFEGALAEWSK